MKKSKVSSHRITIDDIFIYELKLQNKEFDKKLNKNNKKDSRGGQKVQHTIERSVKTSL